MKQAQQGSLPSPGDIVELLFSYSKIRITGQWIAMDKHAVKILHETGELAYSPKLIKTITVKSQSLNGLVRSGELQKSLNS